MPDEATLERRLRAVERSLTDGDHDLATVREAGELTERIATLEAELEDAQERITELEAATQALRGYVGNVRSVNEDVEQRADAALAAVERLEGQLDGQDRKPPTADQRGNAAVDGGFRSKPAGRSGTLEGTTNATPQATDPPSTTDESVHKPGTGNGTGADEDDAGIVQRVREVL